jgi:YHS domain-containing protein
MTPGQEQQREIPNMRTFVTSALAGVFAMSLAVTAMAATNGEFNNMCAEGLAMHKNIRTNCSVNAAYKGKTYCFGNEQAKKQFMKDPAANLAKAEAYFKSEHKG